jgi:surfeit locus 1 family protein
MNNDYSTRPAAAPGGSTLSPADAARRRKRSRIAWFVVALACSLATARLGRWQLDRAHQKLANAALIAERGTLPALPGGVLARDEAGAERQMQRHIVLAGQWDAAHTVFLMNRTLEDGRSGFLASTPLRLADGSAVIVQRGWLPRDDADPMRPPALATPTGTVTITGHVAPWPKHWIELGQGAAGPVRQNIEFAPLAAEVGATLRPVTIIEDVTPGNASDGLRRDWAPPEVGVATNYGYAAQWFAMSVGFLGLWVWLQFFRRRSTGASDPDVDDLSKT